MKIGETGQNNKKKEYLYMYFEKVQIKYLTFIQLSIAVGK